MKIDTKDVQRTEEDVLHLKEWLAKQPHLPAVEDRMLEVFLRGCKNQLERTKQALDRYYTVRRTVPEFFGNRDTNCPRLRKLRNEVTLVFPLPRVTPEGYKVFISHMIDPNPDNFDVTDWTRHTFMSADCVLHSEAPEDQNNGFIIVYDMKDFGLSHAVKMTLPFAKKYVYCIVDSFPKRVTSIHIVNGPPFTEKLLSLFKPFLKKKLAERIVIHNSTDSLLEHFPKEILPQEYGGSGASWYETAAAWDKRLEQHREAFLTEEKVLRSLPPRPGKLPTVDEMFGMEGNFRKLDID